MSKRDFIKDETDHFKGSPEDATRIVMHWVKTYNPSTADIERLLTLMFTQVEDLGRQQGKQLGIEHEKSTNPALRSFGECVREAVKADRKALAATMTKVFEETTKNGNPFYGFNQALKSVTEP